MAASTGVVEVVMVIETGTCEGDACGGRMFHDGKVGDRWHICDTRCGAHDRCRLMVVGTWLMMKDE
jgi:hypothetical protein